MKYLIAASIFFVVFSFNSFARDYKAVMNGGQECVNPDGVGTYCGFDYAVVHHAEGTVECGGTGNMACEYHDNKPGLLLNKLIDHAATNKLNGNLTGNYNLNIIENGIMYYGFVAWSTNSTTGETIANINVNP